jgi:transposase-like protein
MGLLERNGKVRAKVIAAATQATLHREVREHVEAGAELFTDGWKGYSGLHADYIHQVIDHAEKYVDGQIHTNGIENFWSLLKRGLKGTYVSVEPFHLFRYLDEQSFRFNNRTLTDGERFSIVVEHIIGRRLTYSELTGKTESLQP